jgi:hypothetical protein
MTSPRRSAGIVAAHSHRLGERVRGFTELPEALEGVREIVVDGRAHGTPRYHLLEQRHGILPAPLAEQHEPRVERRELVTGTQLIDSAELTHGLVQHAGLVERHAKIPVLGDAGVRRHGFRRLRPTHAMQEPGGDEAVERLAGIELAEPGLVHQPRDVALAVDQSHERFLLDRQLGPALLETVAVHLEHEIEARNLLLDQAPLVDASRALE